MNTRYATAKGFTLVEMVVAIGLFAIVVLVCVGALLSLAGANKKAQAMQSVMNNLNIALDDMVRTIRTGSNYRCGSQSPSGNGDCQSGGESLYLTPYGKDPSNLQNDVAYIFGSPCPAGQLCKETGNGLTMSSPMPITSSDINISSIEFYVVGTARTNTGDTIQPKVVVTITGTAGAASVKTTSTFFMQATAVQRLLDL